MNTKITQLKKNLNIIAIFVLTLTFLMPCLLFSKNSSAITLTSNVQLDRILLGKGNNRCVVNGNTLIGTSASGECNYTHTGTSTLTILNEIYNDQTQDFKKGDTLDFFIGIKALSSDIHNVLWTTATYDYFSVVDFSKVSADEYYSYCERYNAILGQINQYDYYCSDAVANMRPYSDFYHVSLLVNKDVNGVKAGLGYYTTSRSTLFISTNTDFIVFMSDVFVYKNTSEIDRAEQQTQEASDEGEQNAGQADTDNETASQNVIGLVSEVVQVFYTPAGNCNLDVDLGNIDLGSLNLCSGKPQEFAQIINLAGSIIIVYACYRVARTIFRLWIAMSVFGQGGSKGE